MKNGAESNLPRKEQFDEGSLYKLLQDIQTYDRQHSATTTTLRSVADDLLQTIRSTDDLTKGFENIKNTLEQNLISTDIEERNGRIMQALGITIERPHADEQVLQDEHLSLGSLRLNLFDQRKFITYVSHLQPDTLTETDAELLALIARKLVWQLQFEYELSTENDMFLELISGLPAIVSEYHRIGLTAAIASLEEYTHYIHAKCIREFVEVKNHYLLEPVGETFNLSTLQSDPAYLSYDEYLRYWQKNFFDVLEYIKKNPDAKELYEKVLRYGRDSLNYAKYDIDTIAREVFQPNPQSISETRQAMEEVERKLAEF